MTYNIIQLFLLSILTFPTRLDPSKIRDYTVTFLLVGFTNVSNSIWTRQNSNDPPSNVSPPQKIYHLLNGTSKMKSRQPSLTSPHPISFHVSLVLNPKQLLNLSTSFLLHCYHFSVCYLYPKTVFHSCLPPPITFLIQ